jgi:hypothetical protein
VSLVVFIHQESQYIQSFGSAGRDRQLNLNRLFKQSDGSNLATAVVGPILDLK